MLKSYIIWLSGCTSGIVGIAEESELLKLQKKIKKRFRIKRKYILTDVDGTVIIKLSNIAAMSINDIQETNITKNQIGFIKEDNHES